MNSDNDNSVETSVIFFRDFFVRDYKGHLGSCGKNQVKNVHKRGAASAGKCSSPQARGCKWLQWLILTLNRFITLLIPLYLAVITTTDLCAGAFS